MNTEVLDGLDIKKGLNDKKNHKTYKDQFKKLDIDGYVVPKNDEFFSEYSKKDRLKIVSNFSGSAGYAVILKKRTTCLLMEGIIFKLN